MSREQTIARFYFACIALFACVFFPAFWRVAGLHRFTVALLATAITWTLGFVIISILFRRRSRKEVIEDERDRLISYLATFAGGAAGYLALFFGIVMIHQRYAMNGVFTLPVDILYQLFAIVMVVFATVRELAILRLYLPGSAESSR